MKSDNNNSFFSNLSSDLPSSLVVFLVALPLCLGIALASGAPLFSGIIAGIVGGIIVTSISGSPLGVSGPAAGLAAIVASAIIELGSFEIFLVAVVIAGAMQLVFGVLKAGVIGYYFPNAVIKGMLAGIGVIIILKQIPHAMGYDADPEGDMAFLQADGQNTFSELLNMINFISPAAVIISGLSLAILILWEQPFMKRISIFKVVQGPLVAVVLGIALNYFFASIPDFALAGDHLVNIPAATSVSGFIDLFSLPDFSHALRGDIWVIAATIALVASLETLLCVEATDKLDPQKRVTPTNRELIAQGAGNMVSGLVGGLPVTQVIVRSSANIQSGGKTKAAAFFHGILLLITAFAIPNILNMIPLASLAAVLLVVGYKLAKPKLVIDMWHKNRSQLWPFAITVIFIVGIDMLWGIGLGLAAAFLQILWNNYKRPYHFEPGDYVEGQPIKIQLSEDVSFLNKASISRTMHLMPEGSTVILDGSKAVSIHPDVIEILEDFMETAAAKNITVEKIGLDQLDEPSTNPVDHMDHIVGDGPSPKAKKKIVSY